MSNAWLRFGCFLTNYNYKILSQSSEASAKTVQKYTSAILIVSIIWGFIGYSFPKLYLDKGILTSSIVSIVMVVVVIQIERQIILSSGRNVGVTIFRIFIGIVVALIGSLIMDQIMFKHDIEIQKEKNTRTQLLTEVDNQISTLNSEIDSKQLYLDTLFEKYRKEPTVPVVGLGQTTYTRDSSGKMILSGITNVRQSVENPIAKNIPLTQATIEQLRAEQRDQSDHRLKIISGENISNIKNKNSIAGFLDDLVIMRSILTSNQEALIVWLLFILFFLSIEMLVLLCKATDKGNDYDKILTHQKDIRIRMIEKLSEKEGINFSTESSSLI